MIVFPFINLRRVSQFKILLHVLSHFQDFDFKPNFRRYFDRRHEQHIAITLCKVSRDVTFLLTSSRGCEHYLQPAGAALYRLPGVARPPPLGETQPHCVGVVGTLVGCRITNSLVDLRQLKVKYLHGESWRDFKDTECS